MSTTISSDIGSVSSQRGVSRSANTPSSRMANRPDERRDSGSADDAVSIKINNILETDPSVMRTNPAFATGDTLDTMAEVLERYKKVIGEEIPVSPPATTLEVKLPISMKKGNASYEATLLQLPHLDVLG
jgi:hypothetical protein